MVTLQMLTGCKTIINKDYYMSALDLRNMTLTISDEAKTHITVLTELLRDVDLESRMMTLIKAEEFLSGEEMNEIQLQSIRVDLEVELTKIRKMIHSVERAQYNLETI